MPRNMAEEYRDVSEVLATVRANLTTNAHTTVHRRYTGVLYRVLKGYQNYLVRTQGNDVIRLVNADDIPDEPTRGIGEDVMLPSQYLNSRNRDEWGSPNEWFFTVDEWGERGVWVPTTEDIAEITARAGSTRRPATACLVNTNPRTNHNRPAGVLANSRVAILTYDAVSAFTNRTQDAAERLAPGLALGLGDDFRWGFSGGGTILYYWFLND